MLLVWMICTDMVESRDKGGEKVRFETSSIIVSEGLGIRNKMDSVESAVLGERAGCLMIDSAEKSKLL